MPGDGEGGGGGGDGAGQGGTGQGGAGQGAAGQGGAGQGGAGGGAPAPPAPITLPNLQPPNELDVDSPGKRERWLDWKEAYERYLLLFFFEFFINVVNIGYREPVFMQSHEQLDIIYVS